MPYRIDIDNNRRSSKYASSEMMRRILWMICLPLYRFSPRPFFGWRRFVLRLFGARIGKHVHVYSSSVIYMPWNIEIGDWSAIGEHAFIYNLGIVRIGKRVTISQRAHLCAGTHDYSLPDMPLLKPPIEVQDEAWICADAFVGPNVVIGMGAVVGACAVVTRNVDPWIIVAGNPARPIKSRTIQ